jgi:hypothetical protein
MVFVNTTEGAVILIQLPDYATVPPRMRHHIKNIGQGIARIVVADGKTIDSEAQLDLAAGDRCILAKDSENWQTI